MFVPIPKPKRNNDNQRSMEDFIEVTEAEDPALSMEEFLEFVHETTYNITEQLFDNLDKVLEVHVITVTQWIVIENDLGTSIQEFVPQY